jgi:hypothetical protein
MSLTPQLLKCMTPDHALAALRCEMPDEFMPLLDQIEALRPSADELAIMHVWRGHDLTEGELADLAGMAECVGGAPRACELLRAVEKYHRSDEEGAVSKALAMVTRLEQAGITDIDKLDTLLAAVEAIQRVAP